MLLGFVEQDFYYSEWLQMHFWQFLEEQLTNPLNILSVNFAAFQHLIHFYENTRKIEFTTVNLRIEIPIDFVHKLMRFGNIELKQILEYHIFRVDFQVYI